VLNIGADNLASHRLLKRRLMNLLRPRRALASRTPALPHRIDVRPEILAAVRRALRLRRF